MILGASGNAHDVLDIVSAVNASQPTWEVVGFLDDRQKVGSQFLGMIVVGSLGCARKTEDCWFINCIGSDKSYTFRRECIQKTELPASRFATLVHPLANISSRAQLGRGVYVSFGCSVGGGSRLADHVSLGPSVVIGHDSLIGDCSVLAPGSIVSGFVTIGASCYLGARSTIKQGLHVGTKSLVGMGAIVCRDVEADTVVVGNPARPIRKRIETNHSAPFQCIRKRSAQTEGK
jgi:sugar O-acyltransferase (sialic acid O-acetyltransferase NeuD family)